MDVFLTGGEIEFRERAAGYFLGRPAPDPGDAPASAEAIWRDLGAPAGGGPPAPAPGGLGYRLVLLGEASRHDPKLGRGLRTRPEAGASAGPAEDAAVRLAEAAGAAEHVLAAGAEAARAKGLFSSSLMGFREVQERLAGLAASAELARLGAFRLCRLLEKGDGARAAREAAGLGRRAEALDAEARAVAAELLGPPWVEARLPGAEGPARDERTLP